ncbi:MAG: alpha/beta hydrolase [Halioglobus sp.]
MPYNFDPELAQLMEHLPDTVVGMNDPTKAREGFSAMTAALNAELDTTGVEIVDRTIDGPSGAPEIAIRIFTPTNLAENVPALMHIHGGGFVIGDLDSEMGSVVALCRHLNIVVVSVDYRLAPETPYPGGLEDCYAAWLWTVENAGSLHIDTMRLGITGMSAGGGLAAATCLLCRDRDGPQPAFQFLGIPELDDRLETPSMKTFVDTPMWNRPNAELSWDYYLGDQYQRGGDNVPYHAAPARAEDLSNLPPAYVSTMEFDPLRDEGILYALKLMQAGVQVELHSFPGTFHGSTLFSGAKISQRELEEMFAVLKRGLKLES